MKIKYLGPGVQVNVLPFGNHRRGEIKEYPDDFGEDLIATNPEQKFEIIDDPKVEKSKTKRGGLA